jgi:hypothetical protein
MIAVVYREDADAVLGENAAWLTSGSGSGSSNIKSSVSTDRSNARSSGKASSRSPAPAPSVATATTLKTTSKSESMRDTISRRLVASGLSQVTELQTLLAACEEDRFIDLGVRDRAIPLGTWGSESGRIVLMGDSAHPM